MAEAYDVLLIEDSPSQALQFQLILRRGGYTVRVVADGGEGWRAAYADRPRLILLDIDLPTMDGFQILARLKRDRNTATIPIIMLTNREHISNVERALDLAANGYLFKDDAVGALITSVAELIVPATAGPDAAASTGA